MTQEQKSPAMVSDHLEPILRLARRSLRFWHFALLTFALTFAATLGLAELWPKQYRSEAVVYYREGMQWTSNEPASGRRVAQRLKDVLLARSQLAKVVEDFGLHPKLVKAGRMASAVEEVRRAIGFRVERESDVFAVSFTGDSPEEARRVTARLADLLVGENARFRSDQAEVARAFLDEEKKRIVGELASREAAQLRFLANHPEFAEDHSAGMGVSLRARARDDGGATTLQRDDASSPGASGTFGLFSPDPALVTAKAEAETKLRAARRELAERRSRYTEQHPDVRAAEAAVKAAEETSRRAAQALDVARSPSAGLETRAARVQKGKKGTPTEQTEGGRSTRRFVVALEADWARLSRDVAEARERLQQLDNRQFVASMTSSMVATGQAAQIVVIDPAFLPAKPIGMTRTRRFLMALVAACFLATGVAVVLALRDDRVFDQVDVERLQLAPLLLEVTHRNMKDTGKGVAERTRGERPGVELVAAEMTVPGSVRDAPGTATASPAAGPVPSAGTGEGKDASAARTPGPPPEADDGAGGDDGAADAIAGAGTDTGGGADAAAEADSHPVGAPAQSLEAEAGSGTAAGGDGASGSAEAAETGAPPAGSPQAEPETAEEDAESTTERRPVMYATVALALRSRPVTQMARRLPGPEEVEAERDRADLEEELVRLVELVRVQRMAPPWTIDPRLLMLIAPDSAAAAGFRVLRQRLSERAGLRSILVTSSRPEEGKTLCAVNLALALGEAGRARVVLLEANFQHPSLARLLGFHPPACIGEQLEARRTRSAQPWVVAEVGVPWLHTAAVTPGAKAGPIFDGKEFALFVEDLREAGYDYVVIDGPAILGSADANILQESVDGVLLTMRTGRSRGRTLLKAVEQIGSGKVLGVALLAT